VTRTFTWVSLFHNSHYEALSLFEENESFIIFGKVCFIAKANSRLYFFAAVGWRDYLGT